MAYLNRILGVGRKAVFLIFLHVTCLVPHALLFGQNQDFLSRGNDAFLDQKYDVALLHYRQHLRSQPSDVKTWNLVAATYYHLGQPRRTLQILKRYRAQANPRSHNLFYQGLAYDAIVQTESAIRYLTEASQFKDPFAALATFELIAIYAASRDYKSALSWVEHFQQNFPDGPHHQVVADLKAQLQIQEAVNITQSQRHQYQMGLFQRHPWSLFSTPHFWYFQLGYYYAQGSRTNPAIDQQRRPTVDENAPFEDTALRVRASFGLGPYHNKETSYYLGYYYKQDWATTRDRLETYIKEPLDFNYLPFRPDLQLRTHRLLVDFQSYMRAKWSLGIYSHIEFVRAGSSLYPAPERPEIRKTLNVSYSTKFVPWITWQFKDAQGFQAYFPFEKTINQEQSDFSKQNYRLFDVSSPFFSYAFAYQGSFLNDQLKLRTDLFRFSYQHNDYWEDHTRTGLFTKARYRFIPTGACLPASASTPTTMNLNK